MNSHESARRQENRRQENEDPESGRKMGQKNERLETNRNYGTGKELNAEAAEVRRETRRRGKIIDLQNHSEARSLRA
jgi:hypothetical protein